MTGCSNGVQDRAAGELSDDDRPSRTCASRRSPGGPERRSHRRGARRSSSRTAVEHRPSREWSSGPFRRRGLAFADGVPPDHVASAVRLHDHRRPEGRGPASRRGHHRPRVSATPTCPRPTSPSRSSARRPTTSATTATRRRGASRSCARRPRPTTSAASTSTSTPRPR